MENKKKECSKTSKHGWVCSLEVGHIGEVHVALGHGNKVLEVWEIGEEKTLFLKQ